MPVTCTTCGKTITDSQSARLIGAEVLCEACQATRTASVQAKAVEYAAAAQRADVLKKAALPVTLGAIALGLGLLGLTVVVLGIGLFPIFWLLALWTGSAFGFMFVPIGFGLATVAYIIARVGLRGPRKKQPGSLLLKIARSLAEIAIATVLGVVVLLLIFSIIHAYW